MHLRSPLLASLVFYTLFSHQTTALRHFGYCGGGKEGRKYCVPPIDCTTNVEEYLRFDSNGNRISGNTTRSCVNPSRNDLVCCAPRDLRNPPKVSVNFTPRFGGANEATRFGGPNEAIARQRPTIQFPQPPECGTSLGFRIYNGETTSLNEFPWTVVLVYTFADGSKNFLCGATLIDKRWVITAAHCAVKKYTNADLTAVRLGEWNTETDPDCVTDKNGNGYCAPPYVEIPVQKVISHEQFDEPTNRYSNDIALILLKEEAVYSDYIRPLCLPLDENVRNDPLVDATLDISGWGRTVFNGTRSKVKLKAEISIWPLDVCILKYTEFGEFNLDQRQLCGVGKNGADTCRGDSGGPLMMEDETRNKRRYHYLAGIVSYGREKCGGADFPGIYTKTGKYIEWIRRVMEENS